MLRPLLHPTLFAVLLGACVQPEPPATPADAVQPDFAPASELAEAAAAPGDGASPADDAPPPPRAPATPGGTSTPPPDAPDEQPATEGSPAPDPRLTGSIEDLAGDVRAGTPLQDPPDSVDLRSISLERDADGYTVRVGFEGPAPERRRGERITNVATFYDVDGDGELDYQVYATSTSDGWGAAYFDHVGGGSTYVDEQTEVTVEDGVLVLRFPLDHLGGAERLQWSAATQWGTLAELQSGTEARDRAPDDGHGVLWPTQG